MRIIGGEHKGRQLHAPSGRNTRPTADRTREALFNILSARNDVTFDDARILDLFAGSGALGLEAMSRGGAWCLFVETDAGARAAIRDNIEMLGLFGVTRLHRRSAIQLGDKPASAGAPFSLAFLDPPYGQDLVDPALITLRDGGWLTPGAMIVAELGKDDSVPAPGGFTVLDERVYGAAKIILYRFA